MNKLFAKRSPSVNMRKFGITLFVCLSLSSPAMAASTASPVIPGYLTNTLQPNCAYSPCFVPYGQNGQTVVTTPTTGSGIYSAATVGTSDLTILAASSTTVFLDLINNSPTATVCINFGATATISSTTCSAGEVTLPPLWHRSWEGTFIPTDAIHAIASTSSTPVSVGAK